MTGKTARRNALAGAALFLIPTFAFGQSKLELCADAGFQKSCPASCAQIGCIDQNFISGNVNFCVTNFFNEESRGAAKDGPNCIAIFGVGLTETNGGGDSEPVDPESIKVVDSGKDCSTFSRISEQRRCELEKIAPACAPTVIELEKRAGLLVTDIKTELSTYGDLLTRDYSAVEERDALCQFTIAELDQNYAIAAENPAILRSLQRQAQSFQSCQTDWEDFVRGYDTQSSSDIRIDTLVRQSEAELEELKGEIVGLSESVVKLENAKQSIVEIIDVHIFFCDPEGNGLLRDD